MATDQDSEATGPSARRWVITASVVITLVGVIATLIRWIAEGRPRDCLTGGGTTIEALICGGLDLLAQVILLWLIVGVPVLVLIWLATTFLRRRQS